MPFLQPNLCHVKKKNKIRILQNTHKYTVEPPLMATSKQQPFFWPTVHTLSLVSTSLQWPLSSVPKVAIVEGFNCYKNNYCHDWGDFVMVVTAYLVNINGIRCPKCMASDEGPLPVYR